MAESSALRRQLQERDESLRVAMATSNDERAMLLRRVDEAVRDATAARERAERCERERANAVDAEAAATTTLRDIERRLATTLEQQRESDATAERRNAALERSARQRIDEAAQRAVALESALVEAHVARDAANARASALASELDALRVRAAAVDAEHAAMSAAVAALTAEVCFDVLSLSCFFVDENSNQLRDLEASFAQRERADSQLSTLRRIAASAAVDVDLLPRRTSPPSDDAPPSMRRPIDLAPSLTLDKYDRSFSVKSIHVVIKYSERRALLQTSTQLKTLVAQALTPTKTVPPPTTPSSNATSSPLDDARRIERLRAMRSRLALK